MRSPFGLAGHSTLTDKHEDSQKHTFGRDDERQDPERKWIKCSDSRDHVEIQQAPAGDHDQMRQEESHVAYKFCHYVAKSLSWSPALKGVMLQFGDCLNVVLRRILGSSAWQ